MSRRGRVLCSGKPDWWRQRRGSCRLGTHRVRAHLGRPDQQRGRCGTSPERL